MPLPKRPGPYIIVLLLTLMFVLVAWLMHVLESPEIREAVQRKSAREKTQRPERIPDASAPPLAPKSSPGLIDPALQAQADELNSPDQPPERDLEIVSEFIRIYSRAAGGNPVGDNADITAALTGSGGQQGRVFPPGHRTIKDGELIDRWGTPYWFHPNSGSQMEIRSAGPDRQLFTADDVVLNRSPEGFGATPPEAAPLQPQ